MLRMHAPPLPVGLLEPLSGMLGWHLWVQMTPVKAAGAKAAGAKAAA